MQGICLVILFIDNFFALNFLQQKRSSWISWNVYSSRVLNCLNIFLSVHGVVLFPESSVFLPNVVCTSWSWIHCCNPDDHLCLWYLVSWVFSSPSSGHRPPAVVCTWSCLLLYSVCMGPLDRHGQQVSLVEESNPHLYTAGSTTGFWGPPCWSSVQNPELYFLGKHTLE